MAKSLDPMIHDAQRLRTPKKTVALGKHHRVQERVKYAEPPLVTDQVLRIINECDPIQFLMDVVNGCAIQHYVIDKDGEVHEYFDTPSLSQRIATARYLTDKFMPKISYSQHRVMADEFTRAEDRPENGGKPQASFDKMIDHAASKAPKSED